MQQEKPILQSKIEWHTQSTILRQQMGQFEESSTSQPARRSSQTSPDHIVPQNNTENPN